MMRLGQLVLRPSHIPAAVVLVVLVFALVSLDGQTRQNSFQEEQIKVHDRLNLVKTRLEGDLNANLYLVQGLVAAVATNPEMRQSEFSALASRLVAQSSLLRQVAVAPDLKVSMIYPLEGNQQALGLDLAVRSDLYQAALRAKTTGLPVLAGPLELTGGENAVVGRYPVFTRDQDGTKHFWGIVAAVIDADALIAQSGLDNRNDGVSFTVLGRDGMGSIGTRFFGEAMGAHADPITTDIRLPTGTWSISAIPDGGWHENSAALWRVRLLVLGAGFLVLVPVLISGRLIEERQDNIAALASREADLETLSHRLELALDASRVGVWDLNLETGHLFWDERMSELYDVPVKKSYAYEDWANAIHPDDFERASKEFATAIENQASYHSDFRVIHRDGSIRHIRAIGDTINEGRKILGVNWDVTQDAAMSDDLKRAKELAEARNTELEHAKAQIEHSALHDALTGLPNRRYLDRVQKERLSNAGVDGRGVAVLHVDLDRFKQINDTLGHAAGDAMLVHAANVLRSSVRDCDVVARIGGDEFVVVCMAHPHSLDLAHLAERIVSKMREPVLYEGHECRFGVSVGIARGQASEDDLKQLLLNADMALYRAKSRGRNRFEFFNRTLQAELINTKRIADEIFAGLEDGQFIPYYQPQFDAETLDIVGVEALVRWQHPGNGLLLPHAFLRVAEDLNVVSQLDHRVLEMALEDLKDWTRAGIDIPRLSVNVSARRLNHEELISNLKDIDFPSERLSFELVESTFLDQNEGIVAWNLDQIKEMGIDLEIDDFGSGHASILSLVQLQPKRLKIDRQLVIPIIESTRQRRIVESIIEIGSALNVRVVAEGVESMEHAQLLRSMGCHVLQGYAFARPMSKTQLEDFVSEQRWRKAS